MTTRTLALAGVLALAACAPQPAPAPSSVPTPSVASVSTPAPSATTVSVKLALIMMEDDGAHGTQVGCGDSAVILTCTVPNTGTVVESAVAALLDPSADYTASGNCTSSIPAPTVSSPEPGSFMNALSSKGLTLGGITTTGTASQVELSGAITIAGVCEPPRLTAQIEETVRANTPGVTVVTIELNGTADAWTDLGNGSGE